MWKTACAVFYPVDLFTWQIVVSPILQREKADAMAVDGGQVFTAGKCGLVPAMVEQYDDGISMQNILSHVIFVLFLFLTSKF